MTAFLLYIARSGLYLGVFYAFYLLVMRRTTFFRLNRISLLTGSLVCVLLPFLRVRTAPLLVAAGPLTLTGVEDGVAAVAATSFPWPTILLTIYLAGIVAVLVVTAVSAIGITRMARGGQRMWKDGYRTVILSGGEPSFTFGKTIFISGGDLKENPAIFSHETMHVINRHYLDLFLFCIIQMVWWWNPLVWIARTELGLLHEYEADEGVIQKGIDATQYQLLLVRKAVGEQRFSLASGFQHAQLKKRITMMLKPSSGAWMRFAYLALLPLLAAFVHACNPAKNNGAPVPAEETEAPSIETTVSDGQYQVIVTDEPESIPFQLVEVKPMFNGGDANEFSRWFNEHLVYPESAKAAGIQGRITMTFSVNPDGSMGDIKVIKGAHPDLDAEALRVMNSCDLKWTPGRQDGKTVKVHYTFPIVFQIR
ncbi:MAG: M56 family metallopeptidase [Bacteroidales bacterium]|nr:M56 family metallopeptidase [Bacteroidales bacterium]